MAVFHCENCNITKTVPDKFLGRKVRCPQCKKDAAVQAEETLERLADEDGAAPGDEGEAVFRCGRCSHFERAAASAIGTERVCSECGAKAVVTAVDAPEQTPTEDDVDLGDLADELSEDAGEKVESAMPSMPVSAQPAALPDSLLDDRDGPVSLTAGGVFHNLFAGVGTGLASFLFCMALAVLVFPSGWETGYYPIIFDVLVVSTTIGMLLAPLRSRVYFGVVGLDPTTGAVLYLVLAMVIKAMPDAEAVSIFPTALACVMVMAMATGLLAWFTWVCRSGSWIRFMPVQILGGVVAGLGLTIVAAAYRFLTGSALTLDGVLGGMSDISGVIASEAYLVWLPGVLFGVLLLVLFNRVRSPLWLVLAVVVVGGLCTVLRMSGIEIPAQLTEGCGRLSHSLDVSRYALIYTGGFFSQVDWDVLYSVRVEMAAGVVLLLTMALYKITRVESVLGREIRLEKELKVLGANNILAALAGGAPLSFCLGRSLAHRRGGAAGPLAGLVAGVVLVVGLLYAGPLLAYVPAFIPGGLLVFFGLNLFFKWLIAARAEFFRNDDYLLLVLAFVVTVSLGFVIGVGSGLALAMMVSVTRYGSGGVIKQIISGANHRSHVDRAPAQLEHLKQHGDAIFVIRLQGFVTVGSLHGVIRETRRRMASSDREPVSSLIYDFSSVQRFGSAMSQGFARLHALGLDNDINLVLTNVPFEIESRLEAAGYVNDKREGGFKIFQNLDYALEWSENQLLEEAELLGVDDLPLADLLEPVYPVAEHIPYLMKLLQPIKVKANQYVFRQGDPSDAMYFVQSGMYRVELALQGGKTLRLKKMGPGAVFGEMGLYTDAPRSASVVAAEKGVVYRLSKKRIALIETKLPKLKSSIDCYLVNLLAGRIADANAMVRDLMR